jgi:glycosyltransferase involved in cell wall biosynthesis
VTANPRILVFIPCYRCEKQIPRVLAQFTPALAAYVEEVLVVDNRSPDQTVQAAIAALPAVPVSKKTVVVNDDNYSLGGSIKVAFNYAIEHGYDYLIVLHGDDQADIRDLEPVLAQPLQDDMIIGARFHPQSTIKGYSTFRIAGNKAFNLLFSAVFGRRTHDMIAGLNIFKVAPLSTKFYLGFPNNLTFDAHLLLYAFDRGFRVRFVPISWREEDQVSNAKVIRQGLIILKLLGRYVLQRKKLFQVLESNPHATRAYTSQVVYQEKP